MAYAFGLSCLGCSSPEPPGRGAERREEIITGTVIGCRTDARGDTYFEFDNGQVWKEKTDSRVGFEDCNFDVTITKDFFGYKMQIVGEKRRIRISRHK